MARDRAPGIVRALATSWPARFLLLGLVTKLLLLPSGLRTQPALGWVDTAASLALAVGLGYYLIQLLVRLQRRLLWRVRRRLILSYVFVGFIPVLLITAFFVLVGALAMVSTSSFLVRLELDDIVTDAGVIAEGIGREVADGASAEVVLARWRAAVRRDYPELGAVVLGRSGVPNVAVGRWRHAAPPGQVPAWVAPQGFSGIVTVAADATDDTVVLVARATRRIDGGGDVLVDIAVEGAVLANISAVTGIEVEAATIAVTDAPAGAASSPDGRRGGGAPTEFASVDGLAWVAFLERTDWTTGDPGSINLDIRVPPRAFYQRVFGTQARIGDVSVGYIFLVLLGAVGGLFLVMQVAALIMGVALAKSITGSVHELFTGTERVRRGDFRHRIHIASRDQLGELADSFNAMTASVEGLLEQAAEKKRLEEELRIAREIQMSLLPRDTTSIPGLTVTAVCIPAREVGGDYYDFVRLGERRLGILVADVSGKGTSAAFYMAELKGLILSLGQIYESPKRLLIEVNRILAASLDSRSFITMTYAVVDLDNRTLTYARAGHTPLIFVPAGAPATAQVLIPDGLVAGLDGFEAKFDTLLEERCLPIGGGDLAVLFTDGITEAMNEESDLFGETRLSRLLEEHANLSSEDLRQHVLNDVEAFVGAADQHDDMTMVLVKVDAAIARHVDTRPRAAAV